MSDLSGSPMDGKRPKREKVLEASNLVVGRPGNGKHPGFRVRPGSFSLSVGEIILLSGDNGTGKTTILSCLAGLIVPVAGQVLVEGESLYGVFGARTRLRRKVAFVAADPYLFRGTLLDNVIYGLKSRNVGRSQAVRLGLEALEQAGLADFASKPARSLSRGQVRRVAVIRAAILEPRILLLDEPDSDLDAPGRQWLLDLIQGFSARTAVLVSTHASGELAAAAHRVLSVRGGLEGKVHLGE